QLGHVLAHRLWVGPTETVFQVLALAFLVRCHRPFTTQGAVGEREEHGGAAIDGQVEVAGMVLAELEGLEAVDGDRIGLRHVCDELFMKQEAVPAETIELGIDGVWGDVDVVGDLPVCHAAGGLGQELGQDVGSLEVVGGREGL
ncbi:hypothetical protein RZS08_37100, partial [Arthrospira platensis SPKY1]|nr:hypothetical protein [Arthrospira platensis SPKY1]